jgi:PAS domain S-box-containing protein
MWGGRCSVERVGLIAMAPNPVSYVRVPDWPLPVRYGLAVGFAVAAVGLRGLLTGIWGYDLPFLTLFPAVMLSAWLGGFWPGVVTTAVCAAGANYFWISPIGPFRVLRLGDAIALLLFSGSSVLISAVCEMMHRGRRRLGNLLDSIDDGFAVFDREQRCLYANDRVAGLLALSGPILVGKTVQEIFPDIAGAAIEGRLRESLQTHEAVELEAFSTTHKRWFRYRVFPSVDGCAVIFEDTTDRRHGDEAEARLAAIVSSADQAIVGKNLDGIITSWNPAAERLFGFTASEAIGHSIRMVIPAERQAEEDEVLRRLKMGEMVDRFETVRLRKNGTRIDVSLSVSPIKDAADRIVGAAKIASDIGERRRAEAERAGLLAAEQAARARAELAERRATMLADASSVLSSSLESATTLRAVSRLIVPWFADWCIIDLVTRDNTVERVAVAASDPSTEAVLTELQRYSPDWTSAQPAAQALRSAKSVLMADVTDETLVTTARDRVHLDLMRRLAPRSAVAVPLVTRQRIVGAITLVRTTPGHRYDAADLAMAEELARRAAQAVDNARLYAEAEQAREQAEGANRAKDVFLAVLSHELRTPMNAVYGWARMLQMGQIDAATRPRAFDAIVRNSHVQLQLIDDLLDMSRIMSGKMRLEIRPLDLPRVMEAGLDAVRPTAQAKGLRLQSLIDPNAGPVNGDPDRLQQVVWNLLMNAIKFTPKGGRIQLILQRVNSHLEIVVSDTGVGITPDILPFIFDRFRQGTTGSARAQTGLGIGLALVRHLTELHGGSVTAESAGEGQGATFRVKLPLMAASVEVPGERVHPRASGPLVPTYRGPSLRGIRVLIVDDDPDALELIATILRRAEADAMLCSSPPEALTLIRSWKPHVLLSDIEMPGEDGYSLIRKVRALDGAEGGKIPAVALTAYGRPEDRVSSLSAGYSMHVPKPVDPVELGVIVATLVGRPTEPR